MFIDICNPTRSFSRSSVPAQRFGSSFASLVSPRAPSAPLASSLRSIANGPLAFPSGKSLDRVQFHSSPFTLQTSTPASLPFAIDWHRATDGLQNRGIHDRSALSLFFSARRCAVAPCGRHRAETAAAIVATD